MAIHNLALVGCGGVASMHLDGITNRSDRVLLAAVCDPDETHRATVQSRYGVRHAYHSLTEMIAGSEWDVAIVCTPTNVRDRVVSELAMAGKHVYVEKPMSSNLAEARHMVDLCAAASVQLAVDQNFRYYFPFHLAKSAIEQGRIGNVTSILHTDVGFRQDSGWRVNEKRHVLSVMGVHWFDGIRWILGENPYSVVAQNRASSAVTCAGETDSTVTLSFPSGAFATVVQSFSSAWSHTSTIIIGDRGCIKLSYAGMECLGLGEPTDAAPIQANPVFGAHGENKPASAFAGLDNLLTALETGTEPDNSGRDNLNTIAILEAAYESSARQLPLKPNYGEQNRV